MRFILAACLLIALPTIAVSETLKMTAPQEGKALGDLQHGKSNTAPATIEELFTPKPSAKKAAINAAKPDAAAILRDIDTKLDALQLQVGKLNSADDVADEKLLAVVDRLNTLSSSLAAMRKEPAPPEASTDTGKQ